ncbi:MAG: ceramidase domain-containing protein [Hyphomicrobiales bacterium]|nr:ceramidase domain-containing protein [Hyphomicrobiales bacterium]MBV8823398.1 ceramidase domain-containing protein [Hyphomicrobiales bacterium]MBV9426677.1 ceramidase domain-containing protein [Bradyrhizobiaceae bacterium]
MPAIPIASLVAAAASAKQNRPLLAVFCLMAGSLLVLFLLPPIPQDQAYHDFADARTILGIPNFWNVISNIPFAAVGAAGLAQCRRDAATTVIFGSIFLVAFGSSYYHLWPSDETLFWDRLPMALAFMAVFAGTIEERVSAKAGAVLLWPLLAIALISLLVWRWSGDLRLYGWVQFFTLVTVPLIFLLLPPKYTGTRYWIAAAALYLLAKLLEYFDAAVYSFLHVVSGHTLKHLAAAAACWAILRYFQTRQLIAYEKIRAM